eukprot:scaffold26790_cov58-Phaeocystis_antarctica.AAC.4
MSAVQPRLVGKSTLAPRFSSSLTISSWPFVAAACSRAAFEDWPGNSASTGPPLRTHLTTFCTSPRSADRWISMGRGAGEFIAAGCRWVTHGLGFG